MKASEALVFDLDRLEKEILDCLQEGPKSREFLAFATRSSIFNVSNALHRLRTLGWVSGLAVKPCLTQRACNAISKLVEIKALEEEARRNIRREAEESVENAQVP